MREEDPAGTEFTLSPQVKETARSKRRLNFLHLSRESKRNLPCIPNALQVGMGPELGSSCLCSFKGPALPQTLRARHSEQRSRGTEVKLLIMAEGIPKGELGVAVWQAHSLIGR